MGKQRLHESGRQALNSCVAEGVGKALVDVIVVGIRCGKGQKTTGTLIYYSQMGAGSWVGELALLTRAANMMSNAEKRYTTGVPQACDNCEGVL